MNLYCKTCGKLFFIFTLLFTGSLHAIDIPYLEFPADRNNVQVLPQKFEYSLRDASKLLLGNRIIDTSQFRFLIQHSTSSSQINLHWPINLLENGRITFLNPSGVAIWTQDFDKESNGQFSVPNAMSLLQRLMDYSFFRFCVGQYDINTGIDVCSPELTLKGTRKTLRAVNHNHNAKQRPFVQINGRSVTPHGIVFLNDTKESLSFRATAASGAYFKMDTRRINLDFPDVIQVDENTIQVTVTGPPPLSPFQYKRISENKWSVLLRKERPLFYVAGEGRVPLRQEFVVMGPLPTESHRLRLFNSSAKKTYSSTLHLRGSTGKRGVPQATGDNSEVYVVGDKFSWISKGISTGTGKKAYLNVIDESQVFTASYSVSRHPASRAEFFGGFNTNGSRLYAGGEAQTWVEALPFLPDLTTQRLGIGLLYNQDLTGNEKQLLMEFDIFYRLKSGLQFLDPSLVAGLAIQNWSFDSQSLQTLSPLVGWQGPAPKWATLFDWQEADLKYSLPQKKGSIKLNQNLAARWKLYKKIRPEQYIRYSSGLNIQNIETDKKNQSTGIQLDAAWVLLF